MVRFFSIVGVLAVGVLLVAADTSDAARRQGRRSRSRQSFYPPETMVASDRVLLEVRVPNADAKIFFDGEKTTQSGIVREFRTPPLTPGQTYTYEIKCMVMDGDKELVAVKKVPVRAGTRVPVIFTQDNLK